MTYRPEREVNVHIDCPCGAVVFKLCPECEGSDEGCWNCLASRNGRHPGLVDATEYDKQNDDVPLIVVHDGRCTVDHGDA